MWILVPVHDITSILPQEKRQLPAPIYTHPGPSIYNKYVSFDFLYVVHFIWIDKK